MKPNRNTRGRIFLSYKLLALGLMLCAVPFFLLILYPDKASSGPYLNSAHGSSYGVKRSAAGFPNDYAIGNCAHCHEQHASIGGAEPTPTGGPDKYELFATLFTDQSAMFCFQCHTDTNPQQTLSAQYNYSRIAGGDTNICPNDIKEAFQFVNTAGSPQSNCGSSNGSSHFLADIRTLLTNKGSTWNFSSTAEDNDPCSGCHNPHRAQRDPHTSTGRIIAGKLVSSVSRPSQHNRDNNAWGLWGDESGERMSDYVVGYTHQAPCRYPWSDPCTSFEPDGSATTDGSNLVDYVTFCLDCHQSTINRTDPITHYSLNASCTSFQTNTIPAIDWGAAKSSHGKRDVAPADIDEVIAPYISTNPDTINYVLSCLDCHEPHGSPNKFLIRQEINGSQGVNFQDHRDNEQWKTTCNKCHNKNYSSHWTSWCCDSCHRHNPAAGMPGL